MFHFSGIAPLCSVSNSKKILGCTLAAQQVTVRDTVSTCAHGAKTPTYRAYRAVASGPDTLHHGRLVARIGRQLLDTASPHRLRMLGSLVGESVTGVLLHANPKRP